MKGIKLFKRSMCNIAAGEFDKGRVYLSAKKMLRLYYKDLYCPEEIHEELLRLLPQIRETLEKTYKKRCALLTEHFWEHYLDAGKFPKTEEGKTSCVASIKSKKKSFGLTNNQELVCTFIADNLSAGSAKVKKGAERLVDEEAEGGLDAKQLSDYLVKALDDSMPKNLSSSQKKAIRSLRQKLLENGDNGD